MIKNFRDNKGNFPTEAICDDCCKQSEVYICLHVGVSKINICKSCISKYESDINKTIIEECKKGERL